MSNPSSVGVVLVNYNGYEYTRECVNSLLNMNYGGLTIYIVENGSQQKDVDELNRLTHDCSRVILLLVKKNCGLVKANNIGIKRALADKQAFLWILNNDTLVRRDALKLMLKVFQIRSNELSDIVVSSILTYRDPSLIWSNGMHDLPLVNFPKSNNKREKTAHLLASKVEIVRTQYASSVSLLVHRSYCAKHGMMPEEYFIYYDDLDWTSRGMVFIVQQPLVRHLVSATGGIQGSDGFSPFKAYWNARNAILYYFKRKRIPWYEKAIFLGFTIWIMMALYVRDVWTLVSYWRGLKDGLWKTN